MPDAPSLCAICGTALMDARSTPCPGCGQISNPLGDVSGMDNMFAPVSARSSVQAKPVAKTPRDVTIEALQWGAGSSLAGALVGGATGLIICLAFGFVPLRGLMAGAYFGAILGAVFGFVWGALDSLERPLLWGPGIGVFTAAPIGVINYAFMRSTTFMPEQTMFESLMMCILAGTIGGFAVAVFKPED